MDQELITYIIDNCREWMRPSELRALHRIGLTESGEITVKQAAFAEKKIELMYGFSDEETHQLVALGEENLHIKIADRIFKEHYKEAINYCPQCKNWPGHPMPNNADIAGMIGIEEVLYTLQLLCHNKLCIFIYK